jgi:acyl carrier protein
MTDAIHTAVLEALGEVAPEIEPSEVDGGRPLQEQADIDSMDLLLLLEEVAARTGIEVPQQDYDQIPTLDALVEYVSARLP